MLAPRFCKRLKSSPSEQFCRFFHSGRLHLTIDDDVLSSTSTVFSRESDDETKKVCYHNWPVQACVRYYELLPIVFAKAVGLLVRYLILNTYMSSPQNDTKRVVQSFWLLGLLNNAPWVLMLAFATNISSGGVALVFLANQLPGLLAKVSAPCWFHKVSYRSRIQLASLSMALACLLVGLGGLFNDEMSAEEKINNGSSGCYR